MKRRTRLNNIKICQHLVFIALSLFTLATLEAQEELIVEPGVGTLNDAIDEFGGDRIYKLKAGEWYGLTRIIENVDYHLQIIGEPYDDELMPATIQNGDDTDGEVFRNLIKSQGDLTLKNLYLMACDTNGEMTNVATLQNTGLGTRMIIDHCILDPAGRSYTIRHTGGEGKLYFTNNILLGHGYAWGGPANDPIIFDFGSETEDVVACDTFVCENNTFVGTSFIFLSGQFAFDVGYNNFILINHNTFVFHKSQLDWMIFENEYYFTNNLMFDFMVKPWAHHWQPMPGADPGYPKPALIYADTIPGEQLPSGRIEYLQYNTFYHDQRMYELVAEANNTLDEGTKCNLQPFFWKEGMPDKWGQIDVEGAFENSREAHLFNYTGSDGSNENMDFPLWQEGHTTYDIDPRFNDPMIYSLEDSLIAGLYYDIRVNIWKFPAADYPPLSKWPDWHWDPDGNVGQNATWPVFDGTYNEPSLLTGSIEGLPLGDLNWYPEEKARWEAEKDKIFQHMKSGNTWIYQLTGVSPVRGQEPFSRIYPNPVSMTAHIEFNLEYPANVDISIYNTIGQRVRVLLHEPRGTGIHTLTFEKSGLTPGIYFCKVSAGKRSEVHRLMIPGVGLN
jgi:hypothetical protein